MQRLKFALKQLTVFGSRGGGVISESGPGLLPGPQAVKKSPKKNLEATADGEE